MLAFFSLEAKQIFVKNDANGASDGTSWINAFKTVQEAIAASVSGDTVFVARGTYSTTSGYFTFVDKVAILGGFAGDESPVDNNVIQNRDFVLNETVLSADGNDDDNGNLLIDDPSRSDNSYHVFYFLDNLSSLNQGTVLDGFTIQGGNASGSTTEHHDNGGGILLIANNVEVSLSNLIFKNNVANAGGALYIGTYDNGTMDVAIEDVTFFENGANSKDADFTGGGAVFINSMSDAVNHTINFNRVTFENNIAYNSNTSTGMSVFGGALGQYVYEAGSVSDLTMDSCRFISNQAVSDGSSVDGGGIYSESDKSATANIQISNSLFCGNLVTTYGSYAALGAAVGLSEGYYNSGTTNFEIINSTITNNEAALGSGFYLYGNGVHANLVNSIIDNSIYQDNNSTYTNTNSLLDGTEPQLVDRTMCDIRLKLSSPALGTGDGLNGINIGYYQGEGVDVPNITNLDITVEFKLTTVNNTSDYSYFTFEAGNIKDSLELILPEGFKMWTTLDLDKGATNRLVFYPDENDDVGYQFVYVSYKPGEIGTYEYDLTFKAANGQYFRKITGEAVATKVMYVDSSATGLNDGTSWENAFNELYVALESALNGDTVFIAKGTYYPKTDSKSNQFVIKRNMKVLGGFNGDELTIDSSVIASRNFLENETIFSGDIDKDNALSGNTYQVVSVSGGDETVIDGITVTGANNYISNRDYNGIHCSGGGTFRNLKIHNNRGYKNGGGMYLSSGDFLLEDIQFDTNYTYGSHETSYGGAIYAKEANVYMKNCVLNRNEARAYSENYIIGFSARGGGIYLDSCNLEIVNTTFYGNKSYSKKSSASNSSVYNSKGTVYAVNTLFENGGLTNSSGTSAMAYTYYTGTLPASTTDDGNNVITTGSISSRLVAPVEGNFGLYRDSPCYLTGNPDYGKNIGYFQGEGVDFPIVTISVDTLNFGMIPKDQFSDEQFFVISGEKLTSEVTITAPTCFQISLTSGVYIDDQIVLQPTDSILDETTIFVRFVPLSEYDYDYNISIHSQGASNELIAVNGEGGSLPFISGYNQVDFYETGVHDVSFAQSFSIMAYNLYDDLVLVAPENVKISIEQYGVYSDTLRFDPGTGTIYPYVYAKFYPDQEGEYTDSIKISTLHAENDVYIQVTGTAVIQPSLNVSESELYFNNALVNERAIDSIIISGHFLEDDITVSTENHFVISFDKNDFSENAKELTIDKTNAENVVVYVSLLSEYEGQFYENLSVVSMGMFEFIVLQGLVSTVPEIVTISTGSLDFGETLSGNYSVIKGFKISGQNLTNGIWIECPSGFEISLDNTNFTKGNRSVNFEVYGGDLEETWIYVRFNPDNVQLYSGEIMIYSLTRTNAIQVYGTGVDQISSGLYTSIDVLDFGYIEVNSSSQSKTMTIFGEGLPESVEITIPEGYEISVDGEEFDRVNSMTMSTENGTFETDLYVRLAPQYEGFFNDTIKITAVGFLREIMVYGQTVGYTDLEKNNFNLKTYPNPAAEMLYISHEGTSIEMEGIYNLSGQQQKIQVVNPSNFMKIDVSELTGGIYFIRLLIENQPVILRFVKTQ